MHQVYIDIIIDAIIEQFESEKVFYEEYLQLSEEKWFDWKNGHVNLSGEEMQKIKNLFTDYEWMLTQKILRQTILFPEKRNIAVSDYKRLKTLIAKKWLQTSAGIVELIKENKDERKEQLSIHLKVMVTYGEWGFDDIVTFRLPSVLQPQLEGSKMELLDWVNENLTETYVGE